MSEKVICGIYQIKNKINGKSYIGQSKDIYNRWKQHKLVISDNCNSIMKEYPFYQALKKYGIENFDFSILEECSTEELDKKEKYWINKLNTYINSINSNGYNLTIGGQGSSNITPIIENKIIELWNQGLSMSEISQQEKINITTISKILHRCFPTLTSSDFRSRNCALALAKRKVINQYDIFGRFIKQYESICAAAKELNASDKNLSRCLCGKLASYRNYYFIYDTVNQQNTLLKLMKMASKKPIIQLDNDNNFIQIFPCATIAGEYMNPDNKASATMYIRRCANGKQMSSFGYKWQFLFDYLEKSNFNYNKINILINESLNKISGWD